MDTARTQGINLFRSDRNGLGRKELSRIDKFCDGAAQFVDEEWYMYKHTDVSNRVNSINNNNNNSGWIPYQTKLNGGNVNESPSGKNYFECGLPIVDSFVSLFTLVIKMI